MDPHVLGEKYDRIAPWWQAKHSTSDYGLGQIERALAFREDGGAALDVGCGAGGRVIRLLERHGYAVTGLDVSAEMIALAAAHHPDTTFVHEDICAWESQIRFEVVVA